MNILYNLLSVVFFGASAVLTYKLFENKLYWLLLVYLFLGSSYSGQDEVLFGLINLGKHEYRFIPGLTLYSKDIVFLLGFFAILFKVKLRGLTTELQFERVARLFIILLAVNFFAKILFSFESFDFRSIKTLLRWFSPIMMYYIVYYSFRMVDFQKFLFLLQIMLGVISGVFFLMVVGIVQQIGSASSLNFGAVNVVRYPIPNAFALLLSFFLCVGVFFSANKFRLLKTVAAILIPIFIIVGIVSTYRSYTITLILAVVTGLFISFKSSRKSSLLLFVALGGGVLMLIFSYLTSILGYDVGGVGLERLFSSSQEVSRSSGTAGVRIDIMAIMVAQILGSPVNLLFGKIFTINLFDIYGSNNDIGIIATISQGGVLFLIPIILTYRRIFKLVGKTFDNEILETIRSTVVIYFLAIIPSMLFNYDYWFQVFLSQSLFILMGLYDAAYFDYHLKVTEFETEEEEETILTTKRIVNK